MNEWVALLQTFGLATVILIFIAAAGWKIVPWIGTKVIERLVDKYIQLIDSLIVSVTKQGDVFTKVGIVMEQLGRTLENMGQHTIRSMEILESVSKGVADLQNVKTVSIKEPEKVELVHPQSIGHDPVNRK